MLQKIIVESIMVLMRGLATVAAGSFQSIFRPVQPVYSSMRNVRLLLLKPILFANVTLYYGIAKVHRKGFTIFALIFYILWD